MSVAQASLAIVKQAECLGVLHHPSFDLSELFPESSKAERRGVLSLLEGQLAVGEPFFVSRQVTDLVASAMVTVPSWPLRETDVPTTEGFAWLNGHLQLPDDYELRAIGWSAVQAVEGMAESEIGVPSEPVTDAPRGIGVSFWFGRLGSSVTFPCGWKIFPFGRGVLDEEGNDRVGDGRRKEATQCRQFLASFLAFLQQRVLVRERHTADRGARKIAARANLDPKSVTVVLLRRLSAAANGTEASEIIINWSCRWWVAGHWRQQPCGEHRLERRPAWINPHLKGPEDKPIHTRRRLFSVTR